MKKNVSYVDLRDSLLNVHDELGKACALKDVSPDSALYAFLKSALCDVNFALNHIDEFKGI